MIESRNWSVLCIYTTQCQVKTMKSKCYNIQVSYSSCGKFIGNIWWLANLFVLNFAFGWKIILQIEKWAKCHLLLKCGLKIVHMTFGSYVHSLLQIFDFSKLLWAIYEFPFFTCFNFDFSFLLTHMSFWMVFMLALRFLEFYLSNDPNSKLKLWKLAKFWAVWNLVVRTVRG